MQVVKVLRKGKESKALTHYATRTMWIIECFPDSYEEMSKLFLEVIKDKDHSIELSDKIKTLPFHWYDIFYAPFYALHLYASIKNQRKYG